MRGERVQVPCAPLTPNDEVETAWPSPSLTEESRINPLDVVERIASVNDWSFERAGDDEITILIAGRWSDYQLSFTWMNDIEALHLACAFDLKVPERRRNEVQQLISLINEQLWVGHFDLWIKDGMVMFRHALVLAGGAGAVERSSASRCSSTALEACEGYFPAFQFVVWAGKPARDGARRRHVRDLRRGLRPDPISRQFGSSCPAKAGHPAHHGIVDLSA